MSSDVPRGAPELPLTYFAPPERARAEDLAEAIEALRSDELLCRLLDAMPEWVAIANRQRQIVYANQALREHASSTGMGNILGQRLGEVLSCQEAPKSTSGCGTAEACRNCGALLATLQSLEGKKCANECKLLTSCGGCVSALDLRVTATPLDWRAHQYVLLVVADIGAFKRRQVLERIFFHDILNTAGSIQGIADMLSSGDASPDELLGDLSRASETLVSEIQSQKILLAAENNELAVQPTAMRSLDALEFARSSVRNHPAAQGREVVIAPESASFILSSDVALLTRVLGNLLKNALEASDPGQRVTLGCREVTAGMSREAVFWCQNPKCMPRAIQLQVFKRSFSTKGNGRGIGTYSIKLLTERYLRGHVSFVSEPETGTTFTITLPRSLNDNDSAEDSELLN